MTLSETPPEGLLDWIKAQDLQWRDYFIYRAGWQTDPLTGLRHKCVDAVCSACGETVKLYYVPGGGCGHAGYSAPFGFLHPASGDELASGDKLACPMCGEEVEAKHVSSAQRLARYVWPMTAEARDGKLLLYLWRVCRDVEKSGRVTWRVDPWEVYAFGGTSAARWRHWKKYMYSTYILPGWEERKRFADTMFDVELVYCPEGLANIYAETECANCKLESYMSVETEYRFPVAWIRETQVVEYTLLNVLSDEWVIAGLENCPALGGIARFSFSEAIKYVKRGMKVRRAGWNGRNQHIELAVDIRYYSATDAQPRNAYHEDIGSKAIVFCGTRGEQIGWLASQADMLAEDWMFCE